MRALLHRLRALRGDEGLGIVEVVTAFMVFALISVGMAYSLVSMTRLTADSTNRETAANLAAAELDRIQALPDAFDVHSDTTNPITVDGITYNVAYSVEWVSTTGASGVCGTGGGNLQYKRVNVVVTWPGMYLEKPVRADSAMAPQSRINNPAFGTVLVSVLGVDGTGRSTVTVRVTPETGGGGQTIADTIDATDVDGCTYVLSVSPGTYKIEVEKSNYVSSNQLTVPSYTQQVVAAGATTSASFQYEAAGSFALDFAATSSLNPVLPSNIETTYIGGLADFLKSGTSSPLKLHPFAAGYQAVAGNPAECLNVDPANWNTNATMQDGIRAGAVAAAPGGSATLPIPMGVMKVNVPDSYSQRYITAVQQNTVADGNPGCATTKSYTFAQFPRNSTQTIALPYGTWKLYAGNSVGSTSNQLTTGLVPVDGVVSVNETGALLTGILGGSKVAGGVVTLDPRQLT